MWYIIARGLDNPHCIQLASHMLLLVLDTRGVTMWHDIPSWYWLLMCMTLSLKSRCKRCFISVLHFGNASLFMVVMTGYIWAAHACAGVTSFELLLFGGCGLSLRTTELVNRLLICCTAIGSGAAQMSLYREDCHKWICSSKKGLVIKIFNCLRYVKMAWNEQFTYETCIWNL